jgi:predicted branched-subunit amino acid permease
MADSPCSFDGDSDMYGLGIRIGFYLTWFADILGPWIRRSEAPGIRVTISVFIFATFLALLIQTVRDSSRHRPVEVYVILLLIFGQYLSFVPLYAWRVFRRCEPYMIHLGTRE